MNQEPRIITPDQFSRRSFLQRGSAALGGAAFVGALAPERFALGVAGGDEIKLAMVGCGGRGSGAAGQALSTSNLGPVKLVAAADVHEDRMQISLKNLQAKHGESANVAKENQFLGFDAYKKAISMADVVILSTPPGFRPMMFEEAIRQGKHVFMEKPVATDSTGVRKVLAAAKLAKEKNLKVGVGLQRHHQKGYIETLKRLHDGEIGDITSMRCYWNGNTPWVKKREDLEKTYGRKLTEMEYQMRNWYYFTWICGDHIVEQHIHNLDVINWVKKGYPIKAQGMGGCEVRKGPDYGEIFDHHAVEFEYEDGSRCSSYCRHIVGCWNSVSEAVQGTKGRCDVNRYVITPVSGEAWRHKSDGDKDPFQQEHDDFFHAIRGNLPYSEADYGAKSTLTAIMGRMAAYSGKIVEWDAAMNSNLSLAPEIKSMDDAPPVRPDEHGLYAIPVAGKTVAL